MSERNFFAELKRRYVYKVAVAYAVVSWLIAQIAKQIFPFLEIPNWVVAFGDRSKPRMTIFAALAAASGGSAPSR